MGVDPDSLATRCPASAAGRSVRPGGRLTCTVFAATTLAALLAGFVQAGAGQALGRSARGDAVAAVALAMAREMMAVRPVEPTPAPMTTTPAAGSPRPAVTGQGLGHGVERRRLGPRRLDLPPPAA